MLYHIEVHWPTDVEQAVRKLRKHYRPTYTAHARNAARNDHVGSVRLPRTIHLDTYTVIEAEYRDGEVTKLLLRGYHCQDNDLVLALIPQTGQVKTVWLNRRSDAHSTLRRDRYVQG